MKPLRSLKFFEKISLTIYYLILHFIILCSTLQVTCYDLRISKNFKQFFNFFMALSKNKFLKIFSSDTGNMILFIFLVTIVNYFNVHILLKYNILVSFSLLIFYFYYCHLKEFFYIGSKGTNSLMIPFSIFGNEQFELAEYSFIVICFVSYLALASIYLYLHFNAMLNKFVSVPGLNWITDSCYFFLKLNPILLEKKQKA